MSKTKIIAVMNNKGGVLKTTLSTNLAGVLSKQGKKVLLVDADPQGNVSSTFGTNAEDLKNTLAEVLIDKVDVTKAIQENVVPNLDILPTNSSLNHFPALAYSGKVTYPDIQLVLQKVLQKILPNYDYMIIDSAPYMDLVTINVIKASETIIVPAQMETYAAKGLVKLMNDVVDLDGNISAIIPTLFDNRTVLHKEMLEQVKQIAKAKNIKVTDTKITKSIKAANATAYERIPLVLTKSKTKQVKQFFDVVKELGL